MEGSKLLETKWTLHILACALTLGLCVTSLSGVYANGTNSDQSGTESVTDLQPITEELQQLLEQDPQLKDWLEQSLEAAARINPDTDTNPAQTLAGYYEYVDEAAKMLPQDILDNPPDLIRDQILQTICYFYFLVDQPLDSITDPNLFKNAIQYVPDFSKWLRDFANAWGEYLDTPESFTDETYEQFYNDPNFRLQKGDYEPRSNWDSFNRFFSRYLASPDKRPIADPGDASVVVSPADSVPQGVWAIDSNSDIEVDDGNGLEIKNVRYFNVNDLLGPNLVEFHDIFANGVLTHTFLNVYDYHRYHFAVGGTIEGVSKVQQNVALEVRWDSDQGKYVPVDSTGWQFTQTRGIVVVDAGDDFGKVALIPMGMAHVSSVNFEDDVQVGNSVNKGDMLGTFLFGGSDFVILFQEQAGFEIQAPETGQVRALATGSTGDLARPTYQHILMGTRYGQMKGEGSQ